MMTHIADEIIEMLSPIIGKGLATSAVYMQCKKMGVIPENLSNENIGEFSGHFKKIMQIFAGEKVAEEIVLKIEMIKK
ncbi:MAG: hypothetical protein V1862_11910 [Methanobacteriota archaeon]